MSRKAIFRNETNTLYLQKYEDRTVYRYVYSDDISGVDFTRWPIVYGEDSESTDVSGGAPGVAENPLTVKSVNMKVPRNTAEHHTDKFAICRTKSNPQLVVRRGQSLNIEIEFSRPYDSNNDNIMIIFETGDNPMVNKGTQVIIDLSEDWQKTQWSAKIVSVKDNIASVDITPPADCYMARWRFALHVVQQQGSDTIIYLYQHESHIYILFNPWCKEDDVYFAEEALLSEYVLNPMGIIYTGSLDSISSKHWYYGQFDSSILDITLDVLEIAGMSWSQRGSPVTVARSIATVVNSQDDDGVVYGQWEGSFSDGVSPTAWTGSPAILEQYSKTNNSVKYGQCWVFAGVTLTISRALGLPSRCITNYRSAHANDGSITIDVYFDAAGNAKQDVSDTIWNFHVYNEGWMARPDLPAGYGGWQAFDATPQGPSDALVRRGPVSVTAIKQGEINLPYDGSFLFAEVNGDVYYFKDNAFGLPQVEHIEKNYVGQKISTKAANSSQREEVTQSYKYPQGSAEAVAAILKAGQTGSTRPDLFSKAKQILQEDVVFTLVSDQEKQTLGATFEVSLTMKNNSNEQRTISTGRMIVSSVYYTGKVSKQLQKVHFKGLVLNPGEEKLQTIEVTEDEYFDNLEDFCMLNVSVTATVKETSQNFITNKTYSLRQPRLTIKTPRQAVVNQPFNIEVSFVNPYKTHTLTDCFLQLDSVVSFMEFPAGKVNPGVTFKASLPVTATKAGDQEIIMAFQSQQLKGITGETVIHIQAQ